MRRDVYSGFLKLLGNDNRHTLIEGNGVANLLNDLNRFEEAKSLLRKIMPVARRILGESNEVTLAMRMTYASALCLDAGATLDDLREAVTMLEDTERTARRVLGGANPLVLDMERHLRGVRADLRAREERGAGTPSTQHRSKE